MSYFEKIQILGADSPSIDAFSRLRVSNPVTLFDSTPQYTTETLLWQDILNGGTVTHVPNSSSVTLSTAAGTSGNYAYRQTWQYFRYQPGKSQLIMMTGVLGALKANVRQRVGYFDANNGCFFEQDGTNLKTVVRSFTGGSASDDAVNQSAWNLDKMNGTGPSGLTLDMSKTQIFVFDLQWLGVGRVRFGFDINGIIYYVHQSISHANVIAVPYMTSANLPLRWEIINTAAASGATTMSQICAVVISEGGFEDERGYDFSANNGITSIGVTTRRAVLTIRPAATLNSIVYRGQIVPVNIEVGVTSQDTFIEIVYSPVFTGTPTYTAVNTTHSGVEYSIHNDGSAGAITSGGIVVASFTAANAAQRAIYDREVLSRLPLSLDYAGANPRTLSIVATRSSGSGTAQVLGHINWKEIR